MRPSALLVCAALCSCFSDPAQVGEAGSGDASASGTDDASDATGPSTGDASEAGEADATSDSTGSEPHLPGEPLWTAMHDGPAHWNDGYHAVAVDPATGDIVVVGQEAAAVQNPDAHVARYTSAGDLIWAWTADLGEGQPDQLAGVAIDGAGHIAAIGDVAAAGTDPSDLVIMRFLPDGNEELRLPLDPAEGGEYAYGITVDHDDDMIVAAIYMTETQHLDGHVIALGAGGTAQWDHAYNGPANNADFARAVVVDEDDEICWTGEVSVGAGEALQSDVVVQCLRNDGPELWTQTHDGGVFYDHGLSIASVHDRLYVGAAVSKLANQNDQVWIGVYEGADGALLWSAEWGGDAMDSADAIVVDADGHVWIAGRASAEDSDILVGRWDGEGEPAWTTVEMNAGEDRGRGLAWTTDGNLVACGTLELPGHSADAWLRKLAP